MCRNSKGAPNGIFGGRRRRDISALFPAEDRVIREASGGNSTAERHPHITAMIAGQKDMPESTGMPGMK
jgi:hypothetical protein